MILTCLNIPNDHIAHGFFTRRGGHSTGLYNSLNCGYGSGDDINTVEANREIVAKVLDATALCTAYQIHSANVVTLVKPWHWKDAMEADGLVTATRGIALGILTADCLPVLFADSEHNIIGAAHAGWKGAIGGVMENTLEAMEKLGAKREHIIATIGPAIGQASYEVGAEFYERFVSRHGSNSAYFIPSARAEHYQFDLKAYARGRLEKAGVKEVHVLSEDTCALTGDFFSFRRATLQGETVYGRQISAIMLK